MKNCTFRAGQSGKLNILFAPTKFQFQITGRPVINVVFAKGQPLEGQPVVAKLRELAERVRGVVEKVAAAYRQAKKATS